MTTAALAPEAIYNGNGTSTAFPVPFRFLAGTLTVDLIAADGTVARQASGTNYAVTGGATDAGGTVTMTAAPGSGTKLRVRRVTARSQGSDYDTNDIFPAETQEDNFDRAMLIDQEQDVKIADVENRAVRAPDGELLGALPKASERALGVSAFDDDGQPMVLTPADLAARFPGTPGGNVQSIGLFDALPALVVPVGTDRIATTGKSTVGPSAGDYISDPLADPTLAANNPRACKADATGRRFRLMASAARIDAAQFYQPTDGNDLRPAWDAAIRYAIAAGIPHVVSSWGAIHADMRTPLRTTPTWGYETDGIPLVAQGFKRLAIDGGGATINLLGPGGTVDRGVGQISLDNGSGVQPWLGGFCYIVGSDACEYFEIANFTVNGNFDCPDFGVNTYRNGSDLGIRVQDTHVDKVVVRDVYIHHLGAELCYLAGARSTTGKAIDYHVENYRGEYTPQSAFNPNGAGRLTAINVQGGHSYIGVESLGGEGQEWIGCRLYECAVNSFVGGPDPSAPAGHDYAFPTRRTDAAPPSVHFHGLQLEKCGQTILTGEAHGSILAVDSPVIIAGEGPTGIGLDIESWCDRVPLTNAVEITSSAATLTTQIPGSDAGVYYLPPSNIDVRVTCKRTKLAEANGRMHAAGVRLDAHGLYDHPTIRCAIAGEAREAWEIGRADTAVAGFGVPLMVIAEGFQRLGSSSGYDFITGDKSYKVAWGDFSITRTADGTSNITLDTTWSYVPGQRVRFHNDSNNPARITSFAQNGTGLMLNATRTQRRLGEYLELEWSGSKWCEAAFLDQGA